MQSLTCLLTATRFSESLTAQAAHWRHRKVRLRARQTKAEAKNHMTSTGEASPVFTRTLRRVGLLWQRSALLL